jgi:hypothetical protein
LKDSTFRVCVKGLGFRVPHLLEGLSVDDDLWRCTVGLIGIPRHGEGSDSRECRALAGHDSELLEEVAKRLVVRELFRV